MYIIIAIILVVLVLIFIYYYTRKNKKTKYENSFGHSMKNIEKIIENEKDDPFVLAEINNFNIGDTVAADILYAEALQLALYDEIENPERVIDRVVPFTFIMPVMRELQGDDEYYNREIRNDPQNVHDSNVRLDFNEKYEKLLEITGGIKSDVTILKNYCSNSALVVLNKMMISPAYMEIINATDYDILRLVCTRANIYNDIYPALNKSLENCISEDLELVCTTGRISNILDSLTLIDPELGKPVVTIEMLRKDVLQLVLNYLKNMPDERRENEAEKVGEEVEELIRNNFTANELILNKLIEEAKMGI